MKLTNPHPSKEPPDRVSIDRDIAKQIKKWRKFKGWTQARLAKEIGSSQRAIVRLEKGESEPNLATLKKVAHALDLDLIVHFSRPSNPKERKNTPLSAQHAPSFNEINQIKVTLKNQIDTLLRSGVA